MRGLRQILIMFLGTLLLVGVISPAASADTSSTPSFATDASVTSLTEAQEHQIGDNATEAQAASYPCRSTDHFWGSVAWMEHFLHCNHIPFDVYTMVNPMTADKTDDPSNTVVGPAVQPNFTPDATDAAGGPSCSWFYGHLVEKCYQRGVPHLICMQYWSGSYYPYHCGPAHAWNISHSESMWTVIKRLAGSHAALACTKGMLVGGAPAAAILKVAGKSSGLGIVVTTATSCVGGIINYYFRVPGA